MATFVSFDPGSTAAKSADIAGLSGAITKLATALNLGTTEITDLAMTEVYIDADDRYRIFQVPNDKKGWLESPAPIVKKNGVIITPESAQFAVSYIGGSIEFVGQPSTYPTADDTITVSAVCVNDVSAVISAINASLAAIEEHIDNYKGDYASVEALRTALPTSLSGDYALVLGTENMFYIWDSVTGDWVPSAAKIDLTPYALKEDVIAKPTVAGEAGQVLTKTATGEQWATPIDALPKIGGTMSGTLNMGGNPIQNVSSPAEANDAVPQSFLLERLLSYLTTSGGNMSGAINMATNKILNLATPTDDGDAVNKQYVDNSSGMAVYIGVGASAHNFRINKSNYTTYLSNDNPFDYFMIYSSENAGTDLIIVQSTNKNTISIYDQEYGHSPKTSLVIAISSNSAAISMGSGSFCGAIVLPL